MSLESALSDYGLVFTSLVADGDIHRCGTRKKPKGKNGWYIIYDGGKAACYGNWENGDGYEYWGNGEKLTHNYAEQFKNKRNDSYNDAAETALDYIEKCQSEGFSDYLKRKRIYPHGAKFKDNILIIPAQDATGKIWSYQKIYANGDKYFMPGGKVRGCYFLIAGRNVSKDELVVVCEGFATGAAIHQVTNLPVVVAFNAGNLKAVCDSLVFRNLIIAADNDESGTGEKAAKESGYKYVMPKIVGQDYSDLFLDGVDFADDFIQQPKTNNKEIAVTGLVKDIADWITATAIKPQPMLSLAAALAFVAMLKGHRIAGGTDLRTNLLIMAIAPTASGKEHPQGCIKRLCHATLTDKHLMGEPVSGAGLLAGLIKAERIGLLIMDEIGRFIGNLTMKGSGSWQREIIDYIIKTFSCANSWLQGRQAKDDKHNPCITINQPHFVCYGSTVKEKLQAACRSSDVVDGFLNRWLLFSVEERVKRNDNAKFTPPPPELIDAITAYKSVPIKFDSYGEPVPSEARFTPEAWDIFINYRNKMDALIETAKHPMDKLYSRCCEHVEKLALVLCDDVDILPSDVRNAIAIVEKSNKAISEFAGMIADNVGEQDFIRIREIIKEAGEIKRSALTYRCQFVQGGAKRINEICQVLLDSNVIAERKEGNKTYYKFLSA